MLKFSKLSWVAIVFIVLSSASYLAEMAFYNSIDEKGVLQESFFLPLAFILSFIGVLAFLISFFRYFVRRSSE